LNETARAHYASWWYGGGVAGRGKCAAAVDAVVGLLRTTTGVPFAPIVVEFREGLSEEGYIEGHNVALEQRWADTAKALGLSVPDKLLAATNKVIK
jgi:hypothetical protein